MLAYTHARFCVYHFLEVFYVKTVVNLNKLVTDLFLETTLLQILLLNQNSSPFNY